MKMKHHGILVIALLVLAMFAYLPLSYSAGVEVKLVDAKTGYPTLPVNPPGPARVNVVVGGLSAYTLHAWEVVIKWDPTILHTSKELIVEGSFLKAGGPTDFLVHVGLTGEYVRISCTLKSPTGTAPGTGGVLATINFTVVSAGESEIKLESVTLLDVDLKEITVTKLYNAYYYSTQPYVSKTVTPPNPFPGVQVTLDASRSREPDAPYEGDANRDNKVDGRDAGILAANWLPPNNVVPPGDPRADFNKDTKIDGRDAGVLAANWLPPRNSKGIKSATYYITNPRTGQTDEIRAPVSGGKIQPVTYTFPDWLNYALNKETYNITLVVVDSEGEVTVDYEAFRVDRDLAIATIWPAHEDWMETTPLVIPEGEDIFMYVSWVNLGSVTEFTASNATHPATLVSGSCVQLFMYDIDTGEMTQIMKRTGGQLRRYRYWASKEDSDAGIFTWRYDWPPPPARAATVGQVWVWETDGLAGHRFYFFANITVQPGEFDTSNNQLWFNRTITVVSGYEHDIQIGTFWEWGLYAYDTSPYLHGVAPFPSTTTTAYYGTYVNATGYEYGFYKPGTIVPILVGPIFNKGDYDETNVEVRLIVPGGSNYDGSLGGVPLEIHYDSEKGYWYYSQIIEFFNAGNVTYFDSGEYGGEGYISLPMFYWNTTGVEPGPGGALAVYTVSVYVVPTPGEQNITQLTPGSPNWPSDWPMDQEWLAAFVTYDNNVPGQTPYPWEYAYDSFGFGIPEYP
jgi:hypothetical protein